MDATDDSARGVPPIEDYGSLLQGRVAVVTGGGDGIGAAVSRLFAAHSAQVQVAELDETTGRRTVDGIIEAGGTARLHVVDVREATDVERLRSAVLDACGRVDVLVNNVGDYRPLVRFHDSSEESWKAMYDVNLHHVLLMTRAFLPAMIDAGGGSIVNMHSVEGLRGFPGEPVYAAMKAAVAHFTTSLAAGYGRYGIRANGIGPDLTQTPQVDYLTGYEDHAHLWEAWARRPVASDGPRIRPGWRCSWPATCPRSSPGRTSPSTAARSPAAAGSTRRPQAVS